jgi:hypothetical protein
MKFILKRCGTQIIFAVLIYGTCFGAMQRYQEEPEPGEVRCSKCSRRLESDAKVSAAQLIRLVYTNKHIFCMNCTGELVLRGEYITVVPECPICGGGLDLYQYAPLIAIDGHPDYHHVGSSCRRCNCCCCSDECYKCYDECCRRYGENECRDRVERYCFVEGCIKIISASVCCAGIVGGIAALAKAYSH